MPLSCETTDQVFPSFLLAALAVPYTEQNRQGSYHMQFNTSMYRGEGKMVVLSTARYRVRAQVIHPVTFRQTCHHGFRS